jgi:hypothetical protein
MKNDTKLIMETWRKFINEDNQSQDKDEPGHGIVPEKGTVFDEETPVEDPDLSGDDLSDENNDDSDSN